MPQVICNLQNMSGSVSGVAFTRAPDSDGPWVSEDVTEELADYFTAIPGYERLPEPETTLAPPDPMPAFTSQPARKSKQP